MNRRTVIVKWSLILLGIGILVFTSLTGYRFKQALEVRNFYPNEPTTKALAWESLCRRFWGHTPPSVFASELNCYECYGKKLTLKQASILRGWPINRTYNISVQSVDWDPNFAEVLHKLGNMPKLQRWSNSGAKFTKETLPMLAKQAPNLTDLTLTNHDLAVEDFQALELFLNIGTMRLNLYQAGVTPEVLAKISSINSNSKSVCWGGNQLDDSIAPYLATYTNLTSLDLSTNDITYESFQTTDLRKVSYLNIALTKVEPDIWLQQATLMANLKTLHLEQLPLTDAGVATLVKVAPNLTHLHISGTDISDNSVSDFSLLKKLLYLNVRGTQLSPSAIKTLESIIVQVRSP